MNAVSRERSTMGALESFVIDHNSGLPVWIQIKNRIAYLIGSGDAQLESKRKQYRKVPTLCVSSVLFSFLTFLHDLMPFS